MSRITKQDVAYIAELARLAPDDATQERLVRELDEILGYVEKLNELDTSQIDPMMHALEMTNVFREDEPGASLAREQALENAPAHDGEHFLVPRILDSGDA
ncbi:MAG: Asp-tRNA(Asn)/Glu-tRNA(Gln) amidotransferase subunit GatC [Candidatus Hydrogenedentota bacterium]